MADDYRRNNYDDYGDNYGSSSRRKREYEFDDEYPVTARYAPYFNNYDDCSEGGDTAEYENIYSHSQHSRNRRRSEPHRDRRDSRGHNNHRKNKGCFGRFLSSVLVLLLVLTVIGCAVLYVILEPVNYAPVDTSDDFLSWGIEECADELYSSKRVLNIMIFGVDDDSSEYGRSDTMLLLSVDKQHKKIKMTSFQRDTFVYVPDPEGDYHTKLTNAFSYGGVPLAINTIEANYGIKIDHYVTVNFETFKRIVDVLGGVQLELTDREILYINCQIAQNNQTEYLDAQEGLVTLNGQQALWYARNRGGDIINGVEFYEGTDWDRTERQRKFLTAVIDDVKSAGIGELYAIVNEVAPYISTDFTKSELMFLIANSLRYLRFDIEQTSMPSDGNWGYEDNFAGSVIYVYDWETTRSDLKSFIYEN